MNIKTKVIKVATNEKYFMCSIPYFIDLLNLNFDSLIVYLMIVYWLLLLQQKTSVKKEKRQFPNLLSLQDN